MKLYDYDAKGQVLGDTDCKCCFDSVWPKFITPLIIIQAFQSTFTVVLFDGNYELFHTQQLFYLEDIVITHVLF